MIKLFTSKFKLSLTMFLQMASAGAIIPIIGLYLLDTLHFSPSQVGVILAFGSIAFVLGPFVSAFIVNKLVTSKKLLLVTTFSAAVLLGLLYSQKLFYPVLIIYTFYRIAVSPSTGVLMGIVFHHNKREHFGNIRLWGTIGWVVMAWIIGLLWLKRSSLVGVENQISDVLFVGAIGLFLTGITVLFLPEDKEMNASRDTFINMDLLKIMLKVEVVFLIILNIVIIAVDQYYFIYTAPFLKQVGIREYLIMPVMSLAQISEIAIMYMLAGFIKRNGYMKVFIIGVLAESMKFACYYFNSGTNLLIFAQIIHGPAFVFVTIASIIYLDKFCNGNNRSAVMLVYGVFTTGLGNIIGNLFAGRTGNYFLNSVTQKINFNHLFLVPFSISLVTLLILVLFSCKKRQTLIKMRIYIFEKENNALEIE